jgi:uncharacterized membrane protein
MARDRWRAMILIPWVSLPLVAGAYAAFWSRLPESVAVQFDFSGAVSNRMSRGVLVASELAILMFVLANYTFRLWSRRREESNRLIITYYVAVLIILAVFIGILKYNL